MNLPEQNSPAPLGLDAIDTGLSLIEEKGRPDPRDQLEYEEVRAAQLRNELAKSHIKNVEADREMRKQYASRILRYLELYSGSVGVILLLSGAHPLGFQIDKDVLATLVGSTAVAAIGLVGFIARGLFKPPS